MSPGLPAASHHQQERNLSKGDEGEKHPGDKKQSSDCDWGSVAKTVESLSLYSNE